MDDITDLLAFEVKKEIADRYFGFRKRIENDTAAYIERIAGTTLELENSIGIGLVRIYVLLHRKELITSFIDLAGLPADLFFDPYFLESKTIRKNIFTGIGSRGFTRKRRFLNLLLDLYNKLTQALDDYRNTLEELSLEQETIQEEIRYFYRNNDIDSIMTFIRRLEEPSGELNGMLHGGQTIADNQRLSNKLRLHPPLPAEDLLLHLPPVPQLKSIKPQLLSLGEKAFELSPQQEVREFCIPAD